MKTEQPVRVWFKQNGRLVCAWVLPSQIEQRKAA